MDMNNKKDMAKTDKEAGYKLKCLCPDCMKKYLKKHPETLAADNVRLTLVSPDICAKAKMHKPKDVLDADTKTYLLNVAADNGCDLDGDVVYFGDVGYYVNLKKGIIKPLHGNSKKIAKIVAKIRKDTPEYYDSQCHKVVNEEYAKIVEENKYTPDAAGADSKLPVSRVLPEQEAAKVSAILAAFDALVTMAEELGYPLRVNSTTNENMVLYFNDDYPDRILLDKDLSNPKPINGSDTNAIFLTTTPSFNENLLPSKLALGKKFLLYHMNAANLFNYLGLYPGATVARLEGSPSSMAGTHWDVVIIPNCTTVSEVEELKEAFPMAEVMITEGLFREYGFTVDLIREALTYYGYKFSESDEGFCDDDDEDDD